MSFNQIYYHVIFSTKNRLPILHVDQRKTLFNYLWGILKNNKCYLYQMGGVEDHIHILTSIHSTVSLANLVRDMKTSSTVWIKNKNLFPNFPGWQNEYAAFTKSHSHRDNVISYIKDQSKHHKNESSLDELKRLLNESGIVFDEKYIR